MAETLGNVIGFAMKKGAVWGTPVLCGALSGLKPLPGGSIGKDQPPYMDPALGLGPHPVVSDLGLIKVGGNQAFEAYYRGYELAWALFFGTAGAPTQQIATSAYLHSLRLADKTDGLFATVAQYLGNFVAETPSAKIKSIELKWSAGGVAQITIDAVGNDENINEGTGTNNTTTWSNITVPAGGSRIWAGDCVVRMNAQAGAALAGGDVIKPVGGTLKLDRDIEGLYLLGNGKSIDEPKMGGSTGLITTSLTLEFPRWDAAELARMKSFFARDEFKADLIFTGPVIEGVYSYYWKFQFPRLIQNKEGKPGRQKGRIPSTVEFIGMQASAAPTGMIAITEPVNLDIMTTLTTDPLA